MAVIGFRQKEFVMKTPAGNPVAVIGAEWADLGLRERQADEVIHLRDDQHKPCKKCRSYGGVWTTDVGFHQFHASACR